MTYKYTLVAPTTMTIRADHTTAAGAAMAGRNLPAGVVAYGNELWVAPFSGDLVTKGDTWIHVVLVDGNPTPINGWVAVTHLGRVYSQLTDNGVDIPPPPLPEEAIYPKSIDVHYDNGTSETFDLVKRQ